MSEAGTISEQGAGVVGTSSLPSISAIGNTSSSLNEPVQTDLNDNERLVGGDPTKSMPGSVARQSVTSHCQGSEPSGHRSATIISQNEPKDGLLRDRSFDVPSFIFVETSVPKAGQDDETDPITSALPAPITFSTQRKVIIFLIILCTFGIIAGVAMLLVKDSSKNESRQQTNANTINGGDAVIQSDAPTTDLPSLSPLSPNFLPSRQPSIKSQLPSRSPSLLPTELTTRKPSAQPSINTELPSNSPSTHPSARIPSRLPSVVATTEMPTLTQSSTPSVRNVTTHSPTFAHSSRSSSPTAKPSFENITTAPSSPSPTESTSPPSMLTEVPVVSETFDPSRALTEQPSFAPISTSQPSSPDTPSPTLFPSEEPLSEPTPAPSEGSSLDPGVDPELLSMLVHLSTHDGGAALTSSSSTPQNLALRWLSQDPLLDVYSDRQKVQRFVLATFFFGTDGPNWIDSYGWLDESSECSWFSYTPLCLDGESLSEIDLRDNSLSGTIPVELSWVESLVRLNLKQNSLWGTIPTEFGLFKALQFLQLAENYVSGTLPSELASLQRLETMGFSHNDLSGTIPVEYAALTNLERLRLDDNSLSGTIPAELSSLTSLELVDLQANSLTGTVPTELGNLPILWNLTLSDNSLSGTMPEELCSQSDIFIAADCDDVNCSCCSLC